MRLGMLRSTRSQAVGLPGSGRGACSVLPLRVRADREWLAGDPSRAVESYGMLLADRCTAEQARVALQEIARLLDRLAADDPAFRAARRRLRLRIAELLAASQAG